MSTYDKRYRSNWELRHRLFDILRDGGLMSYENLASKARCSVLALHAHVSKLRRRLADCRIDTMKGHGYLMRQTGDNPRIINYDMPHSEFETIDDAVVSYPGSVVPSGDPLLAALRREFPNGHS